MPWSRLNGWLVSHMRSPRIRFPRRYLMALVVALWGGAAVMDWYGLYSVEGWLGSVLVLFIASYVLLATLGGIGFGQPVRRRSGPLIIALLVAIEGATVVVLRYRLALESWLNLVLAFFAISYLLVAVADGLRHNLWRWRRFGWRAVAPPYPAHRGSSDTVSCVAPTDSERRLAPYLQRWSVPALLALVVAVEILAHAGHRSPHITGLQPTSSLQSISAHAEGYIGFLEYVPVYLEAVREVNVRERLQWRSGFWSRYRWP